MNLVKLLSTDLDELGQRIIKFLRLGKMDVQTSKQTGPFGIDSNPIRDMVAVYSPTEEKGKTVIIGYIHKNQLADVGETRVFSTDSSGTLKTYIWMHSNGIMDIGGNTKHLARFEELKTGFDLLKADFNALVVKYNLHTHPYVSPTGPAVSSPTTSTQTQSTASIDSSKTENIKTG